MQKYFCKKLICFFIMMCIVGNFINVQAFAGNYAVESEQNISEEEVAERISQGDFLRKTRSSMYLSVYAYTQGDSRWANYQVNSYTMASDGCLVTSFAMILRYYKGVTYTPLTVLNDMGDKAIPFYWGIAESLYDFSCSVVTGQSVNGYISIISSYINMGRPIIIELQGPSSHYVVAYGYSGDTIYINDPATTSQNVTLQDYFAKGYYITALRIYMPN